MGLSELKEEFSTVPSLLLDDFPCGGGKLAPAWRIAKVVLGAKSSGLEFEAQITDIRMFFEAHFATCTFESAFEKLKVFAES